MNRPEQAEASFRSALATSEKLADAGLISAANRRNVAGAHYYLGVLQRIGGRLVEAEASTRRALEIFEESVRTDPSDAVHHDWLARAQLQLGLVQSSSGRRSEAVQSWTAAAAQFAAAAEIHDPRVNVFARMGDTLALLGRWQQAADAFAQATVSANYAWRPQFQWALLQLAAGDEKGYATTCADLLVRQGDDPSTAAAAGIVWACVAGQLPAEEMSKVDRIARRLAESNKLNPAFQALLGATKFRAGQTQEAIELLRKSLPLHPVAAAAAPHQRDEIQVSWLMGETILALAYHKLNDEQAIAKQLDVVRKLVQELEAANPYYSEDFGEWALPLAILLSKRSLAQIEGR